MEWWQAFNPNYYLTSKITIQNRTGETIQSSVNAVHKTITENWNLVSCEFFEINRDKHFTWIRPAGKYTITVKTNEKNSEIKKFVIEKPGQDFIITIKSFSKLTYTAHVASEANNLDEQKKQVIPVAQNIECKDDEKSPAKKSDIKCSYFTTATALIKQEFPMISSKSFNELGDMCYCDKCHKKRADKLIYSRGDPPKRYALPVGWIRFGLTIDDAFCETHKVWNNWHVAFHGTQKATVPLIFGGRLILLKAGDVAVGGSQLGIRDGHIPKPFKRDNLYTKKKEMFDPNQIFASPSINIVIKA